MAAAKFTEGKPCAMAELADADDVTLTVTRASCWQPVAVDADGTPLHHGERMVQVRPGVWADPAVAGIEAFLAARIGTVHTD